jgi:hypothetical protein
MYINRKQAFCDIYSRLHVVTICCERVVYLKIMDNLVLKYLVGNEAAIFLSSGGSSSCVYRFCSEEGALGTKWIRSPVWPKAVVSGKH